MIDQVNRSRGISLGGRLKNEFIVFGEPVGDLSGKIAGVAFLTCIRVVGKANAAGLWANDRLSVPENVAEPFFTTMKVAWDAPWIVVFG